MPAQETYSEIAERNQHVVRNLTAALQTLPRQQAKTRKLGQDANRKFKAKDRDAPAASIPSPKNVNDMLEATALLIAIAQERQLDIGIALPNGGVLPLTEKAFREGMKKWNNGGESLLPALEISLGLLNKLKRSTAPEKIISIILADPNIRKLKPASKKPAAPKV